MSIYVGIDVASEKHDCCIMAADRSVLKQFSFKNDAEGFDYLLSSMSEYAAVEETYIGLESTGVYGNNLVEFLRRKGYETSTFNPLLIKKSIQATTLRKTKTDKADARFLALYLTQEPFKPDTQVSYHISELKSLSRSRFSLVQERAEAKTKLKSVLIQLFPEFSKVFSDVFGASALAVLSKYPSAEAISKCKLKTLTEIISKASHGRLGKDRAEQLIELAKHSIGTHSATLELDLSVYIDKISLLTKHIKVYEAKIKEFMSAIDSSITSIPGIGYILGAMILSEIGDISRFATPAKLLAFAGLDPSVIQSGKSVSASGSMVKRGSKYLRWALGQAARCVAISNPVFSAYLQTKLNQGKHYSVACSHVAKKLVRVIFAILKNNSHFSLNYSSLAA